MDAWILAWSNQRLVHPILDVSMIGLSTVGLAMIPIFGLMIYAKLSRRSVGRALLIAQLVALLCTLAFYYLALRPRPDGVRLIMTMPPLPSFPSGHAAIAFATATVWSLYRRSLLHTLGAFGFALLIGYSRIYLGHHFPSDVIAGCILGAGIGAAAFGVFATTDGTRSDRLRWFLWFQIAVVLIVTQMAYLGYLPMYILKLQYADKVLHFLLFGAITFWLTLWFQDNGIRMRYVVIPFAILLPFSVAAVEEGFQLLSTRRNADFIDLISDLLGMLVLYGVARYLTRRNTKSPRIRTADSI